MPRLPFAAGKNLNKAFNARGAGSTSGRVVGKDELLSRVWPGTFVQESSLSQNIYLLRRALGGDHYIETVPKIAYRFTVPVDPEAFEPDQKIPPDPPSPAPNQVTNRWNSRLWFVALIPLLASGFLLWRHRSYPSPTAQIRSIAVLPFVSLGEQANQTALADGLTEQLIYEPTRSSGLHVVARTSSSQFRNQTQDVRETGRSLNVDAILEARQIVHKLEDRSRHGYRSAEQIAHIYSALGERGPALKWLHKAYEQRAFGMTFLDAFSAYDFLRGDRDYERIRAAIRLPGPWD
jgi:hypothetical protein